MEQELKEDFRGMEGGKTRCVGCLTSALLVTSSSHNINVFFSSFFLSIPGPNRIVGGGGEVDKARAAVGGGSGLFGSRRAASVTNKVMEEEEEPKEEVRPVIRSWLG